MQLHRKTGLVFPVLLLFGLCAGFIWAKAAVVVGMVTEVQGHAYWQNDTKKNRVQELAELPENAKLVLAKGSKLTLVYLASGQQYEFTGPGLVQFKNAKPIALSGAISRTIGAAPVLTKKTKIDPKKVQTAGQTLVSTEAEADPNLPVGYAPPPPAPAPPPPPPAAAAPVAAARPLEPRPEASIEAMAARERMQAYEAAKLAVEAEMMAAKQAETAASAARESEVAAQEAARRAAEAAAAKSQRRQAECESETGNKKTDADKNSETSGTSIEKSATDCSPLIIDQQN